MQIPEKNTVALLVGGILLTTSVIGSASAQQQQLPFTIPENLQQQEQEQAPQQEQENQGQNGLSMAELIKKYAQDHENIELPPHIQSKVGQKAVVLTFDDNWKSQYNLALPILEQYGFNATFFVYCLGIEQGPGFMTEDMIRDLYKRGFDIQSHSMTHPHLDHVSTEQLDFEIRQSKLCLEDMVPGLNVSIFAVPFAEARMNATVLDKIAETYEFDRTGYAPTFYLGCDGYYVEHGNQTAGCQLYEPETGEMKFQNYLNLGAYDVNSIGRENNYSIPETHREFTSMMGENLEYNRETGKITGLPILVYHNLTATFDENGMAQALLLDAFKDQMAWLDENGFTVLSIRDLVYDPVNATFSIPKLDFD